MRHYSALELVRRSTHLHRLNDGARGEVSECLMFAGNAELLWIWKTVIANLCSMSDGGDKLADIVQQNQSSSVICKNWPLSFSNGTSAVSADVFIHQGQEKSWRDLLALTKRDWNSCLELKAEDVSKKSACHVFHVTFLPCIDD